MAWYDEFNSYFWLTLAGLIGTGVTMLTKAALKSNCTEVSCCCFTCKREPTGDDLDMSATDSTHLNQANIV
jgi:hypothetical protein